MQKFDLLLELKNPIYLDKEYLKGNFTKINSFKIIASEKDEELYKIDFKKSLYGKKYLIIDMDATKEEQQKRFISMIKDKKFRAYNFDDDLKVIVTSSSIESLINEVAGLLVF